MKAQLAVFFLALLCFGYINSTQIHKIQTSLRCAGCPAASTTTATSTSTTPQTSTTTSSTPSTTTTSTPVTTTTASTPSTTTTTTTTAPSTTIVSGVGSSLSGDWKACVLATSIPGADIADNANLYPDPFAFYTDDRYPGVTLIGPTRGQKCGWTVGKNFVWDPDWNTCILNGQGYPIDMLYLHCSNNKYSTNETDFTDRVHKFQAYAINNGKQHVNDDGSIAYLTTFTLDGEKIEAAFSVGHGVLSGLCGDCFVVKQDSRYVALFQTDVRAWSLELSAGANTYLASDNYGGTCYIPDVKKVDCGLFMGSQQ